MPPPCWGCKQENAYKRRKLVYRSVSAPLASLFVCCFDHHMCTPTLPTPTYVQAQVSFPRLIMAGGHGIG